MMKQLMNQLKVDLEKLDPSTNATLRDYALSDEETKHFNIERGGYMSAILSLYKKINSYD